MNSIAAAQCPISGSQPTTIIVNSAASSIEEVFWDSLCVAKSAPIVTKASPCLLTFAIPKKWWAYPCHNLMSYLRCKETHASKRLLRKAQKLHKFYVQNTPLSCNGHGNKFANVFAQNLRQRCYSDGRKRMMEVHKCTQLCTYTICGYFPNLVASVIFAGCK